MKTKVHATENQSLEYALAQHELEELATVTRRKAFTVEIDKLLLEYFTTVPVTNLLQIVNEQFDKDFSEPTIRRRVRLLQADTPDKDEKDD